MVMRVRYICVLVLAAGAVGAMFGQTAAILGAGYRNPAPLDVSPGQIVTIFATGVGTGITHSIVASTQPLPTSLGGITVSFTQLYSPAGPLLVPLLSVFPFSTCSGAQAGPCAKLLGITLQIPFELKANTPGTSAVANFAQLIVSDGVVTSSATGLNPLRDQVHIVQYGDTIMPGGGSGPVITHADGTLVSATSPARIGEILSAYVTGLGATTPSVPTGAPSPSPAAKANSQFTVVYDYRPNATASGMLVAPLAGGLSGGPMPQASPLFAGLTAGLTGIDQVNFAVPAPPPTTGSVPPCGGSVRSNLTIDLIGPDSFDGAGICVGTATTAATQSSMASPDAAVSNLALTASQPQQGSNFVPNTIWFPPGADITNLGQPVPPGAEGLPPEQKIGVGKP
jgi:uncharacterized protein (TIGR03437 family)